MSVPPDEAEMQAARLDVIEMLAAAWVSRRDRGFTAEEAVEFVGWRAADARHEAAVADLSAMWDAFDDLPALQGHAASRPESAAQKPVPRRAWLGWSLAAAASVALIASLALRRERSPEAVVVTRYVTVVGEQRAVTLSDGSMLRLNVDSAVEVRYGAKERRVELVRGEARFTVTTDAARPFVVATGAVMARAVGTSFFMQRREAGTELVVTEGRVKFGATNDATAVEVVAGQVAVSDPRNPQALRVVTADPLSMARRIAWEQGRVICYPGMTLAELAREFNRYHRQKIVLQDAATAALPVGGAFELRNLEALVGVLEGSFDVRVVEREAERLALKLQR